MIFLHELEILFNSERNVIAVQIIDTFFTGKKLKTKLFETVNKRLIGLHLMSQSYLKFVPHLSHTRFVLSSVTALLH